MTPTLLARPATRSRVIPERPKPLPVAAGNIPQALVSFPQWVLWRYEFDGKKWTKPPFQTNGKKASKMNTNHWTDFSEAIAAYNDLDSDFDGIGFVLTENDPFMAVDLDHCSNQDSSINDFAKGIINHMGSYTEFSPSGEGIRIFARGKLPRNRKSKQIELYDHAWYLTVTGQQIGDFAL